MQLNRVVETAEALRATRSRNTKTELLAAVLADLEPHEVPIGVSFLSGQPRQDRLDVGWAAVREVEAPPADAPSLTLTEVDDTFQQLADASGSGSRTARLDALRELLARATAPEQDYIRGLVLRELRQGALEGVMVQAVAAATGIDIGIIRRAVMLSADLGLVATVARTEGEAALRDLRLELFRPVLPMLAATSPDVPSALDDLGPAIVEEKLDGARVQVHRDGREVRIYTRNLRDVTARLPEVVAASLAIEAQQVVLDGEALSLDGEGRPRPFQETMSRFGSERGEDAAGDDASGDDLRMTVRFFDLLHLDGEQVLDLPTERRRELLRATVPDAYLLASELIADPTEGVTFLRQALDRGHEGVMVKALDVPYEAGRRGSGWRKVKPVHTLDLVVLAAEWGSGRRRGWLSNLHLGARDPESGGFVMLGKTFKGLTDETLTWQTEALLEREVRRTKHVVHVEPELVVEIAIDGVQSSTTYPGGVALRFARVRGYRPDRSPADADTIETVRAIHRGELRPDV